MRRIHLLVVSLLAALALVVVPFGGPASSVDVTDNVVADPGFEIGSVAWTLSDSAFGTPRCDAACGNGAGTAGPRSGGTWLWFGGGGELPQSAVATQDVVIPQGKLAATLEYYLWVGAYPAGSDASLILTYDGIEIDRVDSSTLSTPTPGYVLRSVDLPSAGGTHKISFTYLNTVAGEGSTNIGIDDLSLVPVDPPPATTVTKKPAAKITKVKNTRASVSFTSSTPGSTFECKHNGGSYKTCSSPWNLTRLATGDHVLRIRAVSPGGSHDPTSAVVRFAVVKR